MSANTGEFVRFVLDQLAPLSGLSSGRFFGGTGLKCRGQQFAMLMNNTLYFVVAEATRPRYLAAGSACFSYDNGTRRVQVRRYQEVPVRVLENTRALQQWAREAMAAAAPQSPPRGSRFRHTLATSLGRSRCRLRRESTLR